MKIVNPETSINEIKFIPRNNSVSSFELELINETTKDEFFFLITPTYVNGVVSFDLNFNFTEGDKYEFKCFQQGLSELENVIYRGKIFATTQEPQNYELSKDLYYYE